MNVTAYDGELHKDSHHGLLYFHTVLQNKEELILVIITIAIQRDFINYSGLFP